MTASRQGWWGDTYATVAGDRIGSRLWLLQREKILPLTLQRAEAYAKEALQWMIDDRLVERITVNAVRGAEACQVDLRVVLFKRQSERAFDAVFKDVLNGI